MIDQHLLNEVIVPRVDILCGKFSEGMLVNEIEEHLHIPQLKRVEDKEEAISLLYKGFVLLYFEEGQLLFSGNIEKKPNRNPEESKLESTVKGPRDNYIEDIATNIALIRKRLPTNSLCVEKLEVGKRSKTAVAILYFDDIANKDTLKEIKKQLEQVDTDIIFGGEALMEYVNKKAPLFPRAEYTGRPDFTVQSLVRGRFVILVDGIAYALITPINLFFLLKTGEDNEYPIIFSTLDRLLRVAGILIGIILPAMWLALSTFHLNQIPFQLLATVVQANTGLPIPSALEMLIMIGMFELFREAGLRLPSALGGTIGVVGGLIVGDAAIRAGVTSPAMVVIIAVSTIATFTLVNQSLLTAVIIVRVIFVLFTAIFGLFGLFVAIFLLLTYLANIRVFGVPYMGIAADISWSNFSKTFFRVAQKQYSKRPDALKTQDKTRNKEGKDE